MSLSSCSLSVGQMVLIKYASNTLRLRKFSGALLMMVHVNLWVGFSFKCLAGSDVIYHEKLRFYNKNFTTFNSYLVFCFFILTWQILIL